MRTLEDSLAERMKNPEFRAEYEALELEFTSVQEIIDVSTQEQLEKTEIAKDGLYNEN